MNRPDDELAPQPNWLVRAYYTPVADALRGQLSGRLDARREIALARLPAPLAALVLDVVRRTRLWRHEKLDVTRELTAHFADGLAAGRPTEDLVRDFGSISQAARLIRKAKLRNRPLIWQIWRAATRVMFASTMVAVVAYAWLAARFYLGQPTIAHNYWHEINTARRTADENRAWPLYREALIKLGPQQVWIDTDRVARGPEGKHWAESVVQLERHKESLELARRGAKKPRLGYYLGDKADLQAARAEGAAWTVNARMPLADENKELIAAHLHGPNNMRALARLLVMDARVAAAAGDSPRAAADFAALVGLAEQLFEPQATLVEQLIGIAIFGVTVDALERTIADTPAALSDDDLQALAHRIAAFRNGRVEIDFSGEQMMFDDIMQRAYTDNGRGDGRITSAGISMLVELADSTPSILKMCDPRNAPDRMTLLAGQLLSPGTAAFVGSRRENSELYHGLLAEIIAAHQGDPWHWDAKALDECERRLKKAAEPPLNRLRYAFVALLLPAVSAVFNAAERSTQMRDAAEVVIALELWRRRHGAWPDRLEQLVPELLPEVPSDRMDGQPLRYVVRDGKPALYTIGADRVDDGGKPDSEDPFNAFPISYGPAPPNWKASEGNLGDYIFFPPEPEEIEEEVDDEPPGQEANE